MSEWQQVPANSRNTEPRSMTASRIEKTGRHRDINSPGKNGKLQVSKRKSGTQVRSEPWRRKEYHNTTNPQLLTRLLTIYNFGVRNLRHKLADEAEYSFHIPAPKYQIMFSF